MHHTPHLISTVFFAATRKEHTEQLHAIGTAFLHVLAAVVGSSVSRCTRLSSWLTVRLDPRRAGTAA